MMSPGEAAATMATPKPGDPGWAEHVAAIKANDPRPMPDDFMPTVTETGGAVFAQVGSEFKFEMGFIKQADEASNERLMLGLRKAVWQANELVRLGRERELLNEDEA